MNALGLSPAQLVERKLRLHAGDAASIMAGDYRAVWQRFQPDYVPDDLSGEFRVQLGSYTEPFNLAWTMKMTGRPIIYYSANQMMRDIWLKLTGGTIVSATANELVVSKRYPFMACNLDGMTTTPQGHRCVIDAKHVGRSTKAEILRYTPAGVWQATCAGTNWWALSMIVGNKWELPIYQEVDPIYQATMIARAHDCWSWIENETEAELAPAVKTAVLPPKPQPRLRSLVVPTEADEVFDALCRRENWLREAFDHVRAIVGTQAAATVNAINREAMKTLVPEDIGEVKLGRYRLARSKNGSVTQTVAKLEDDDGW